MDSKKFECSIITVGVCLLLLSAHTSDTYTSAPLLFFSERSSWRLRMYLMA